MFAHGVARSVCVLGAMFLVADAYALGAASRITSVCLGYHDGFVACMRIVYAFTGVWLVGGLTLLV